MKKLSTAAETMTKTLVTIGWDRPMDEANRKMEDGRIRHLPVTDADGFVIGILSDRDVNRAMDPNRPGFSAGQVVSEFMSWPAITVDEHVSLREIAEGMVDEKVSAFLVTKEGKEVVGIVTSEDLLRFLAEMLREGGDKKFSLRNLPYTPIVREALRELESVGI